ncbi:LysR family transcriptional regulator [Streptomyces sp. NPDC007251]|uniref:LysR family transcriptional regulator n=1 Tax=unclassified Streptomyces TaxID=2593676 RepID=UPI0033FF7603
MLAVVSRPSASARVRSLEHHAGVALLIRGRRGVRPTPVGTTLACHARDVLDQTAQLESAVASYTRSPTAPLILLGGGSAMHRLVPKSLISFLRAHPGR